MVKRFFRWRPFRIQNHSFLATPLTSYQTGLYWNGYVTCHPVQYGKWSGLSVLQNVKLQCFLSILIIGLLCIGTVKYGLSSTNFSVLRTSSFFTSFCRTRLLRCCPIARVKDAVITSRWSKRRKALTILRCIQQKFLFSGWIDGREHFIVCQGHCHQHYCS